MKRFILLIITVLLMVSAVACNEQATDSAKTTLATTNPISNDRESDYVVLETRGANTIAPAHKINHNEELINTDYFPFDLKSFRNFTKTPTPKNITIEIEEGIYEELAYFGTDNDYYFNSEWDMYRKDVEGTFLEIYKKVNTDKVVFCLYDSDELNKKYENAAIISAEESVAIAKEHFKNYVGSEEIASQFEFNVTVEFDNEYSVTATRYVNGLRTYEEVAYVVGSHGNIFSYYVDVDATMDVNKCPNQEQMLVVEAAAKNKLEEIYGDSRIDSYTCGEVEPLFVRLSNGSYAVEYNFTNLNIKTSKNAEPITDPTRLFVILE